ncbi:MAG: hypothetical protein ABIT96_12960 [Ferruginibacter sp.]
MKKLFYSLALLSLMSSCATTNMTNYYNQNQAQLDVIHKSFKELYKSREFSIEFNDKNFEHIFLEMFTDTLRYIYEFGINEPRLKDTLAKFNLAPAKTIDLITRMKAIECKGVSNMTYYGDGKESNLVFMAIKKKDIRWPFTPQKYYVLTYYDQPQYYDKDGRLVDNRSMKRLKKLNGDIFKRVNSRVAYTISEHAR